MANVFPHSGDAAGGLQVKKIREHIEGEGFKRRARAWCDVMLYRQHKYRVFCLRGAVSCNVVAVTWCRRRESNSHAFWAKALKASVSTVPPPRLINLYCKCTASALGVYFRRLILTNYTIESWKYHRISLLR